MTLQEKINFILDTAVNSILRETSIVGRNERTLGTLSKDHKEDLRILFDAELSYRCGDINNGQHQEIQNLHHLA